MVFKTLLSLLGVQTLAVLPGPAALGGRGAAGLPADEEVRASLHGNRGLAKGEKERTGR